MISPDSVVDTARKYTPWTAPWWVALVQGLLAGGLGVLLLLYPAEAATVLGQFLALYLLIHGLFEFAGLSNRTRSTMAMQIAYYRGIAGAVVGGVLISLLFLNLLTRDSGLFWLSIGLLVYGAGGLYLAFARGSGNGRLLSIVGAALLLVLGAVGLTGQISETSSLAAWISWTLVILGIGLVILAIVRRGSMSNGAAADAAASKAASIR